MTKRLQLRDNTGLHFNIGKDNLTSAKIADSSMIKVAGELQQLDSAITLDFSYIENGDFADGTYYVALISYGLTYASLNPNIIATDGDVATYLGYTWGGGDSNSRSADTLYAIVEISNVIPEPSTYAAIFGALALAFAAYRRRG